MAFVFPGALGLAMGEELTESTTSRTSRGVTGAVLIIVGIVIGKDESSQLEVDLCARRLCGVLCSMRALDSLGCLGWCCLVRGVTIVHRLAGIACCMVARVSHGQPPLRSSVAGCATRG